MSILLSRTLSKRMNADNLPKGLKEAKLASKDLARLKEFWLKRELRDEDSWERFLKIYDTVRNFIVDPRARGVDLPVAIEDKGRESVVILFHASKLIKATPRALATLTLTQSVAPGGIVGGSTFVLKAAKPS
jgi:hypothetical protein